MSNIAISFEHVSKMYQLGVVGTGTISNDLKRWWQMSVLGKDDPFLKIGQTNDRATKAQSEYVYALRDIDFKVEQGDVVGLIGKNGAGKSTLLKLLSRITAPTTGCIKAKGRIASLLEVGTGFHVELTGRQNIYMNGAIMGMTKQEIDRKFDEIVDFAGCEMYIDTPTKRYSSGMQVRLGFAVAAFLEPEILVVDEVLAVGDAEFQKKAIGKMQDVATNGGRTVLFVSHNMNSVRSLCKSGVVLSNGMVEMMGTANECVDFYTGTNISDLVSFAVVEPKHRKMIFSREVEIVSAIILNDVFAVSTEEPLEIEMIIRRNVKNIKRAQFGVVINNSADLRVGAYYTEMVQFGEQGQEYKVSVSVPYHQLAKGKYSLDLSISIYDYSANPRHYDCAFRILSFQVSHVDAGHHRLFSEWPHQLGNIAYRVGTVELQTIC